MWSNLKLNKVVSNLDPFDNYEEMQNVVYRTYLTGILDRTTPLNTFSISPKLFNEVFIFKE